MMKMSNQQVSYGHLMQVCWFINFPGHPSTRQASQANPQMRLVSISRRSVLQLGHGLLAPFSEKQVFTQGSHPSNCLQHLAQMGRCIGATQQILHCSASYTHRRAQKREMTGERGTILFRQHVVPVCTFYQ